MVRVLVVVVGLVMPEALRADPWVAPAASPPLKVERPVGTKGDPRPARWCAWWLRRHLGIPRSAFRKWEWNLARAFRYIGTAVPRGTAGAIAVWRSHVGQVKAVRQGRRGLEVLLLSGNDGGAVRTRWRSARGIIAWRRL